MADLINNSTASTSLSDLDKAAKEASNSIIDGLKEQLAENESKIQVSQGPLHWLKAVNTFLEGIPATITTCFKTIFKAGERVPQKGVDLICQWLAWKVNIAVERKRQQIIKSLYEQYGFMFEIQKKINKVKEMLFNPLAILGAVVNAVKTILNFFFGPFIYVVQYIIDIVKEVSRLANNLQNIASALPPEPPDPNINFNEFKLDIGKMGISVLTDDPANMPSPEEMFPEPVRPFGSYYWKALANEAAQVYRDEKPFYSMNNSVEDIKKLNAEIKNAHAQKKASD